MSLQTKQFYEFANFRLDLIEKVLLRDGEPVPLTPKVFDTLRILIENAGHLLEKERLMREIWQDHFVEEGNLAFNIKVLRKALGDNAARPHFIETVQRRGYRFIAEVRQRDESIPPRAAAAETAHLPQPAQKPYILISIGLLSLISIFGIAFVWVGGSNFFKGGQPKFTRLTSSGKITNAVVTPDGKNIVFSQKEGIGESLWVRKLDSRAQRQILPPQDVEFVGLTVSPDNRFAYFSVFSKNTINLSLARIALENGTTEPLADVESDVSISFSPDGKKFAYTESWTSLKETKLKTADADGSNQKILITAKNDRRMFPVFRANPVAWSPDGETIAGVVQVINENDSSYKILLVDPETGVERYLSEKSWYYLENIVWKDAENLAFIEYEPNSPIRRIWEISRKTGETRQLTNDLNGYEWLSSSGGNLFTLQKNVFSSIHVGEFAEATATLQSKQIFGESSKIENVAWSRAGRIFYNSWTSGKNEIWQIGADGAAPRQLTTDSNLTLSFAVSPIDDRLVFPTLENGRIRLSAADAAGQNIRQLTDGTLDIEPSFSPDGKNVLFQRGSPATLWGIAADGSQAPSQITGYQATSASFSPDGKRIAFHFMDYGGPNPHWKLGLIDRESRRFLNKLDFPIPIFQRKTVWHPKSELLTMVFTSGETSGILLWSVADNKFRTIDNVGAGKINSLAWSADGSRLVFAQTFETSDVVSLDNF
jgi:DNA-binding winged helix-turn-helix (wHTH) protein/Tol biopolymer transport system component